MHTWIDAVRAALDECADDVDFRRSVPADAESGVDLIERLAERLGPDEVARRARAKLVDSRRPILDGQLDEVRALDSITVDTPLERRPTVIADLRGTTLSFEGKHADVSRTRRATSSRPCSPRTRPFTAADLPGPLDEESRLVLVRRLIREGFLRRSAAGA